MAGAKEYVCTLTEASLVKAKAELCEDPANRLGAVETLRKWILEEPHIKCGTDTNYLLRFLRPGKYSQLETRKMMEKFLTAKATYSEWMQNIDMNNKKCQNVLNSGYFLVLPGTDKEGRKVVVYRISTLDTSGKLYKKADLMKTLIGATFALLQDENVQVNGFNSFLDMTDFSTKQMNFFGVDDIRKMTKMYTGTFPTRLKVFNYYNTGPAFEAVMAIMLSVMAQKMRDRIVVHGSNLESIYEVIPKEMLPVEYLPDDYTGPNAGTIQDVIEYTKSLVASEKVTKHLLWETGKDFAIDLSKKREDVPVASFRSLNVS